MFVDNVFHLWFLKAQAVLSLFVDVLVMMVVDASNALKDLS